MSGQAIVEQAARGEQPARTNGPPPTAHAAVGGVSASVRTCVAAWQLMLPRLPAVMVVLILDVEAS